MPGPFPGMDPFLENHWGDVHTSLTTYARNQLQPQLPPGLRARVEEYVAVELEDRWHARKPNVRVVEEPPVAARSAATALLPDVAEELIVELDAEPRTERTVYIVDQTSGERVVTSIEFLSPWNKEPGEGREGFRRKQRELLEGGVNLVEIDLVRAGWLGDFRPRTRTTGAVLLPVSRLCAASPRADSRRVLQGPVAGSIARDPRPVTARRRGRSA